MPDTKRPVYKDGIPVPPPGHRCLVDGIKVRENARSQRHPCKLDKAHEGNHTCICGLDWPTEPKEIR